MLKEKYVKIVVPSLQDKLQIKNIMDVPKIEKVVLNM
jgi:large subunit ribosomal protein L5